MTAFRLRKALVSARNLALGHETAGQYSRDVGAKGSQESENELDVLVERGGIYRKDAHQFLWNGGPRWDAMKIRTEQFAVRLESFALQNEYPRHFTPDTVSSAEIEAAVHTSRQTSWDPRHPGSIVSLEHGADI
jgi:hypothetical protein